MSNTWSPFTSAEHKVPRCFLQKNAVFWAEAYRPCPGYRGFRQDHYSLLFPSLRSFVWTKKALFSVWGLQGNSDVENFHSHSWDLPWHEKSISQFILLKTSSMELWATATTTCVAKVWPHVQSGMSTVAIINHFLIVFNARSTRGNPCPGNLAKNPWSGSLHTPSLYTWDKTITIVLLTGQSIKLSSDFSSLYPEISAARRHHQRSFFV